MSLMRERAQGFMEAACVPVPVAVLAPSHLGPNAVCAQVETFMH